MDFRNQAFAHDFRLLHSELPAETIWAEIQGKCQQSRCRQKPRQHTSAEPISAHLRLNASRIQWPLSAFLLYSTPPMPTAQHREARPPRPCLAVPLPCLDVDAAHLPSRSRSRSRSAPSRVSGRLWVILSEVWAPARPSGVPDGRGVPPGGPQGRRGPAGAGGPPTH